MKNECNCNKCQYACRVRPGWFLPGEAEKAAEYLGVTLKEFFDRDLSVDWLESADDIFVLAPRIKGKNGGKMYSGNPIGECVFFKDGGCSIHDVKPFECSESHHDERIEDSKKRHEKTAEAWKEHHGQIRDLFGQEPYASEYIGGLGIFGGWP